MRVVSWNVNGIRSRIERIQAFLERHDPDVLCLQETKVQDANFPRLAFMGHHIEAYGQPSFNGVAIISKNRPDEVLRGFDGDPTDHKRCIAARFGDLWVYDLYVVNGKSVDDPAFYVKKDWMEGLRETVEARHTKDEQVLLVGDWNITPTDLDTHDPHGMKERIHHTSAERNWLAGFGRTDLHRLAMDQRGVKETRDSLESEFTWWDYRASAFGRGKGLRIDLALGTDAVANRMTDVWVDRDERKVGDHAEKPSDHAPLVVDLS